MGAAIADGRISDSFQATLDQWDDRNINHFGEPKKSGDDCAETIEAQLPYLSDAGFEKAEAAWSTKLWAAMVGRKANR